MATADGKASQSIFKATPDGDNLKHLIVHGADIVQVGVPANNPPVPAKRRSEPAPSGRRVKPARSYKTSKCLRPQKMQQIANCQQIGATTWGEVFLDKAVI